MAAAAHRLLCAGVSRPDADDLTGPTGPARTADARASGQQVAKKPDRVTVVGGKNAAFELVGLPGVNAFSGVSKAQIHRIAALINADYNFPWGEVA